MISATDSAVTKIKQQLKNRGKGLGIRVGVRTTGCSGLAYVMEFVDSPTETDVNVDCGEFSVFVDLKSKPYLDGLTLDYIKKGLNEGFEFINPQETARCGCGESFSV
jgi:iron-sulfur cluster assembly protein